MKRIEVQLDLFGEVKPCLDVRARHRTRVPHNGSAGSRAAAEAVEPVFNGQCARVLDVIERAGARGITRKDISARLGLAESTVCARVFTLMGKGGAAWFPVVEELGAEDRRLPDCGGSVRQAVLVRRKVEGGGV